MYFSNCLSQYTESFAGFVEDSVQTITSKSLRPLHCVQITAEITLVKLLFLGHHVI